MANEEELTLANNMYNLLRSTFKQLDIKCMEDQENLSIYCKASGEDLHMDFYISVDPDFMQVRMDSQLPFDVPENKRMDMAVAINIINNRLVAGCFDYDVRSDKVYFRVENSYLGSPLNSNIFIYMVSISVNTVDKYNDKLFMLTKNMISLEKFTDFVMGGN